MNGLNQYPTHAFMYSDNRGPVSEYFPQGKQYASQIVRLLKRVGMLVAKRRLLRFGRSAKQPPAWAYLPHTWTSIAWKQSRPREAAGFGYYDSLFR